MDRMRLTSMSSSSASLMKSSHTFGQSSIHSFNLSAVSMRIFVLHDLDRPSPTLVKAEKSRLRTQRPRSGNSLISSKKLANECGPLKGILLYIKGVTILLKLPQISKGPRCK